MTDTVVLILLGYLFYAGWSKGFLRTLLGPLSLILACMAGFSYYQHTRSLVPSLMIGILGPFILNILFSFSINVWHTTVNQGTPPSTLSRVLGCGFSLLWGGSYLILVLISIMIIPADFSWLKAMREDLRHSQTHAVLSRWIAEKTPLKTMDIPKITAMLQDPVHRPQIESLEEYKSLMEEDALKEVFSDEETLRQIQEKNIAELLANPKIQAALQNEEIVKKLLDLNVKIIQQSAEPQTSEEVKPAWLETPIETQ